MEFSCVPLFFFPLFFRACVQLDLPANILFQVDCLVYSLQSEEHEVMPPPREAMHVQSISHWAPANIGPYSQAIKVPMPGVMHC